MNLSNFSETNPALSKVSRLECKIKTGEGYGSGFFLQYSIGDVNFFCLVSNEHAITEEMTKNIKIKIQFTYIIDSEYENFTLQLDENEKFIKSFKQIKIDLTVVQILPKDKISEVYFLSPDIDYSDKN